MEVYGQWGAWQLPHPAEGSAQSTGGGAEKAECSTALRGSCGKYKLASSASFAQIFFAVLLSSVTQCGGSSYSQGMGAPEKQT